MHSSYYKVKLVEGKLSGLAKKSLIIHPLNEIEQQWTLKVNKAIQMRQLTVSTLTSRENR